MPFKSESQRRFLWAKHPEIAQRWSDEYPGQKNLPKKLGKKAASKAAERRVANNAAKKCPRCGGTIKNGVCTKCGYKVKGYK